MATKVTVLCLGLMAIGLLLTVPGYSKIDPGTVVGLWLFDEGKGDTVKDSSGNGNDGKLMGNPKWIKGKFGNALEFDGDGDYVDCGNADILSMENEITVLFWVKTSKKMVAMWTDRQVIVGKHYLEYEVGIYPQGQIHTYTNDGTGGGYDEGIMASMVEEIGDGDWVRDKWYHIAWTLNGNHEIAYVNGVKIGEHNKAHKGTKPGTHHLEIGRREGDGLYLTGAVDEVAVLNVTLGEEDIKDCMNLGMERVLGITAVSPGNKLATSWAAIKAR